MNPIEGLRRVRLDEPGQPPLFIARATWHGGDPWGVLAPLRGTPWEAFIQVVTGDAMSHAAHGFLRPLQAQLGTPPHAMSRRVPAALAFCVRRTTCAMATDACVPGKKVPDCIDPPEGGAAAAAVVLSWRDGFHVVVVLGDEIS